MDVVALAAAAGVPAVQTHVLAERPGRVVARLHTPDGHRAVLKADRAPGSFAPEVAAIERLRGFPVPTVLAHRPDAAGWDVLVLSWTEGAPLSAESPRAAQEEAGRLLRRIHRMPPGPRRSTVAEWIASWVDELAAWWEYGDRLRRWHDDVRPVLAGRPGSLMLFDARPEHFRVAGERVSGLIDLHDLGPGDPAMDLAAINLDDPGLLPGVLRGYGGEPDPLVSFFTAVRAVASAEWHGRFGPAERADLMRGRAITATGGW